jgi:hypothetical protein
MNKIIELLIEYYFQNDIFRFALIIVVLIFVGYKIFYKRQITVFKVKSLKYEYIRIMFQDKDKNYRQSFLFAVQEYLGMKLNENEIDYMVENNFFYISNHIKHSHSKLKFVNGEYKLKYPTLGFIWAIVFFIITSIPTLFYISFIAEIKSVLSDVQFISLNILILPLFIYLTIVSSYNLSSFGSAKSICKYQKN